MEHDHALAAFDHLDGACFSVFLRSAARRALASAHALPVAAGAGVYAAGRIGGHRVGGPVEPTGWMDGAIPLFAGRDAGPDAPGRRRRKRIGNSDSWTGPRRVPCGRAPHPDCGRDRHHPADPARAQPARRGPPARADGAQRAGPRSPNGPPPCPHPWRTAPGDGAALRRRGGAAHLRYAAARHPPAACADRPARRAPHDPHPRIGTRAPPRRAGPVGRTARGRGLRYPSRAAAAAAFDRSGP